MFKVYNYEICITDKINQYSFVIHEYYYKLIDILTFLYIITFNSAEVIIINFCIFSLSLTIKFTVSCKNEYKYL